MALLIGIESCKVDSNGRFKFPVALKKQLGSSDDNRFAIRQSIYNNCLELWTYQAFIEETETLKAQLNRYDPEDLEILGALTEANIIEMDTNDRLLIPSEQKDVLTNDKEIVLVGMGQNIQIWSAEEYRKMKQRTRNTLAEKIKNRLGNKEENTVNNEVN